MWRRPDQGLRMVRAARKADIRAVMRGKCALGLHSGAGPQTSDCPLQGPMQVARIFRESGGALFEVLSRRASGKRWADDDSGRGARVLVHEMGICAIGGAKRSGFRGGTGPKAPSRERSDSGGAGGVSCDCEEYGCSVCICTRCVGGGPVELRVRCSTRQNGKCKCKVERRTGTSLDSSPLLSALLFLQHRSESPPKRLRRRPFPWLEREDLAESSTMSGAVRCSAQLSPARRRPNPRPRTLTVQYSTVSHQIPLHTASGHPSALQRSFD